MTKKHSDAETPQFEKKVKKLEKAKTEEALLESEDKYQSLLESSNDPIYLVDRELKYLYANKKLLSRYGKSLSEVTGQSYANFHSPEATKLFFNRVKKVLKSGKPFAYEYKSQRDGKDFLRTLNPFINRSTGEITAITVISKDISEQKQMARALEISEEKLRNFIESSTIGIWCFRLESPVDIALPKEKMLKEFFKSVCVECNETYAVMMDATKDEILGTVLSEVMPDTEENRAYLEAFINNNFRISGGISHEIGKNGLEKYFSNSMVGTIKNGKLVEAWGTQTDITELKRVEKNLQFISSISEQVTDSIIVTDINFNITYVNKATEELYGYSKKELLGKTPDILNANSHKAQIQENIYETVSSGKTWTGEHLNRKKDGSTFICEFKISPLKDEEDNILGYIAIQRDCTERKQAEEKLLFEQKQLLSMFDSIDEVIYVADPATYELIYFNEAFKSRWKGKAGDKCYKVLQDRTSPCPFCTNKDIFGENLGKTYIWEFQNLVDKRWYRCIDKAIKWPDERMVRYEMAVDITERKRAEQEVRESEEKYRTLFKETPIGILTCDTKGIIQNVNIAALKILGSPSEDATKQINLLTFHLLKEAGISDDVKHCIKEGCIISSEKPYTTKWGKSLIIQSKMIPITDEKGKVNGVLCAFDDISERKRAEEALRDSEENFRNIFHFVPESLLAVNDKIEVLNSNKAFEKLISRYAPELDMSENELRKKIISELRKHFGKTKHGLIEIRKTAEK